MFKALKFTAWSKNEKRYIPFEEICLEDGKFFFMTTEEDKDGKIVNKKDFDVVVLHYTGLYDDKKTPLKEGDVVDVGGGLYLIGWDGKKLSWGLFTLSATSQNRSPHMPLEDYYFVGNGMGVFWEDRGAGDPVKRVGDILENPDYVKPPEEPEDKNA